jgi:hypothetical protein
MPNTIIGMAMPSRYPVSSETRLIHAVPTSIAAQPTTVSASLPTRVREVNAAAANAAAVTGRNASPASNGL